MLYPLLQYETNCLDILLSLDLLRKFIFKNLLEVFPFVVSVKYLIGTSYLKSSKKEAKNTLQRLIKEKKKKNFSKKLEEDIGEPKELWKNLKKLGLFVFLLSFHC